MFPNLIGLVDFMKKKRSFNEQNIYRLFVFQLSNLFVYLADAEATLTVGPGLHMRGRSTCALPLLSLKLCAEPNPPSRHLPSRECDAMGC